MYAMFLAGGKAFWAKTANVGEEESSPSTATTAKPIQKTATFHLAFAFVYLSLFFLTSEMSTSKALRNEIAQCLAAIALKNNITNKMREKKQKQHQQEGKKVESARRNSNFIFFLFRAHHKLSMITENKRKYYKPEMNLLQCLMASHKMKEN